jgi:hypothetical protein
MLLSLTPLVKGENTALVNNRQISSGDYDGQRLLRVTFYFPPPPSLFIKEALPQSCRRVSATSVTMRGCIE